MFIVLNEHLISGTYSIIDVLGLVRMFPRINSENSNVNIVGSDLQLPCRANICAPATPEELFTARGLTGWRLIIHHLGLKGPCQPLSVPPGFVFQLILEKRPLGKQP